MPLLYLPWFSLFFSNRHTCFFNTFRIFFCVFYLIFLIWLLSHLEMNANIHTDRRSQGCRSSDGSGGRDRDAGVCQVRGEATAAEGSGSGAVDDGQGLIGHCARVMGNDGMQRSRGHGVSGNSYIRCWVGHWLGKRRGKGKEGVLHCCIGQGRCTCMLLYIRHKIIIPLYLLGNGVSSAAPH